MQFYLFSAKKANNRTIEEDEVIFTRWKDGSTLSGRQDLYDSSGLLKFQDLAEIRGTFGHTFFKMNEFTVFQGQLKATISLDEEYAVTYEFYWKNSMHVVLRLFDFMTGDPSVIPRCQILQPSVYPEFQLEAREFDGNQAFTFGDFRIYINPSTNFTPQIEQGLNVSIKQNNKQLEFELCEPIDGEDMTKVTKLFVNQANMMKEVFYCKGTDRNNIIFIHMDGLEGWRVTFNTELDEGVLEGFYDDYRIINLSFCAAFKKWKATGSFCDQDLIIRGDTSLIITEEQLKATSLISAIQEKVAELKQEEISTD